MNKVKLPNKLFWDERLSRSAKLVGGVLYAYRNAFGVCRKSGVELAALARISPDIIGKAVQELQAAGYITVSSSSYYSESKQRMVRGKNVYTCDLHVLREGYTYLPRKVFQSELTISQRLVYISLYVAAGNQNRAFPSISRLQKMTGCARSTICMALQALRQLPELLIRRCQKRNRAFSSNSYHFCIVLPAAVREISSQQRFQLSEKEPVRRTAVFSSALKSWACWISACVQRIRTVLSSFGGSSIFRQLS